MRCVMNNIANILHNFYLIGQWHRHPFEECSYNLEELHKMNVREHEDEEIGGETEKVENEEDGLMNRTWMLIWWKIRKECLAWLYWM